MAGVVTAILVATACTSSDRSAEPGAQVDTADLGFGVGPSFEVITDSLSPSIRAVTWAADGNTAILEVTHELVDSPAYSNHDLLVFDASSGETRDLAVEASVTEVNASISPDGDRVVYAVNQRGGEDWASGPGAVWIVDIDGREARQLSSEFETGVLLPHWSPDGDSVSFVVEGSEGQERLMLIQPDGSGETELARGTFTHLDWSPDGTRIVFSTGIEDSEVFVITTDSGAIDQLTSGSGGSAMPAWSPDGERIAFVRHTDFGENAPKFWWTTDIHVMNSDGTGDTRLTSNHSNNWEPLWSPDGQWIAFQTSAPFFSDIRIIRADGTDMRNMTSNFGPDGPYGWAADSAAVRYVRWFDPAFEYDDSESLEVSLVSTALEAAPARWIDLEVEGFVASWSPTGRDLAYTGISGDEETTVVIAADGSDYLRWLDGSLNSGARLWSPDGRSVLVRRQTPNGEQLIAVDLETGAEIVLLDAELAYWSWSPDGRWIAAAIWNEERGNMVLVSPDGAELVDLGIEVDHWVAYRDRPTWSPDGSQLAIGELIIPVDDVEAPTAVSIPDRIVESLVWSPDGRRVLALSYPLDSEEYQRIPDTARWSFVDLETNEIVDTDIDDYLGPIFSPDGRNVAYLEASDPDRSDQKLAVVNIDGTTTHPGPDREAHDLRGWSSNTEIVVDLGVVGLDGSFGSYVSPFVPHGATAISPDGRYVAILGESGTGTPQLGIFALNALEALPATAGY